jgi:hypothetical protein
VRQAVRQALGFPWALEAVLLLSVLSFVFSLACCAASSKGWFISRTGTDADFMRTTYSVGWAYYVSETETNFG